MYVEGYKSRGMGPHWMNIGDLCVILNGKAVRIFVIF